MSISWTVLRFPVISQEITDLVKDLLGPRYAGIHQLTVQQQRNDSDCGVFAIAFATCIVYQQDPSEVYLIYQECAHTC